MLYIILAVISIGAALKTNYYTDDGVYVEHYTPKEAIILGFVLPIYLGIVILIPFIVGGLLLLVLIAIIVGSIWITQNMP